MAFPSVYEMFAPLTTVRKQHFWDYFTGGSLNTRWNTHNRVGSNTFAMSNTGGGFSITTSTATNAEGLIGFNDKRPFNQDGSVFIFVVKRDSGATTIQMMGGNSSNSDYLSDYSAYRDASSDTYKSLQTHDGSSLTTTNSDVAVNQDWITGKIEMTSANHKLNLDGVLKATSTTNLPSSRLQPVMRGYSSGSTAKTVSIRYCEAYNT